jgi:hypothetical protein
LTKWPERAGATPGRPRCHALRALTLDLSNVWANSIYLSVTNEPVARRVARAQAMVAAHPQVWLGWLVLAIAYSKAGSRLRRCRVRSRLTKAG